MVAGGLVVAGGDVAPLREPVEAAFDDASAPSCSRLPRAAINYRPRCHGRADQCGLEGAIMLARSLRDVEPLLSVGRVLGPQYRGIALTAAGVSLPGDVTAGR